MNENKDVSAQRNPMLSADLQSSASQHEVVSAPAPEWNLEPIRARMDAATAGPWTNGIRGSGSTGDAHMCRIIARGHALAKNPNIAGAMVGMTWHPEHVISYVGLSRQECIDNAEFMAHAREDIPALIAEIERLRAAALDAAPSIQKEQICDTNTSTPAGVSSAIVHDGIATANSKATSDAPSDGPPQRTSLSDEILDSLRSGYLFGNHDEPLDAASRRVLRVIQQRLT